MVRAPSADIEVALDTNREVYEFLRTASSKYGIGFWKPGSGIIHQVVLENYAFPGGMMIGDRLPHAERLRSRHDRHRCRRRPTPSTSWRAGRTTHGAEAASAFGLTGTLSGWTAAKDIILKIGRHPDRQGRDGCDRAVLRSRARSRSPDTGKATVCNMGAEIGATCSLFGYDHNTAKYLKATGREAIGDLADQYAEFLVDEPRWKRIPNGSSTA